MTQTTPEQSSSAPTNQRARRTLSGIRRFIADYFWFIFKNVVGWIFIVGALPVGLTVPGPGGIPLFLIGFALVTFPGKRKLTTRVMRGVPVHVDPAYFTFLVTIISVLITAGLLAFVANKYDALLKTLHLEISIFQLLGVCALAAFVTFLTMQGLLFALNFILRRLPKLRRKLRPWLKRKGIHLLPPRRTMVGTSHEATDRPADEIVTFDEKYSRNLRGMWSQLRPWLKRLFAVAITVWIFVRILKPIYEKWGNPEIKARLSQISIGSFLLAALMFAIFLFVFRAMAWRRILSKLGHTIPVAPATRIWSTSELARYVPGAILQVIGRVMLAKPYGVRGSVTSVSQILELAIFLLANVIIAVSCFLYFGIKNLQGDARNWMIVAAALVPVLLVLLHPTICYRLINTVMRRLGKPDIAKPLSGRQMLAILAWNIVGLIWQSLAIFVLTEKVLGLKIDWWWVVAGAYCLAWSAGFLAVWAPAGAGVRELVFVAAMSFILPKDVQLKLGDPAELAVILGMLALLLRAWATTGELMLAAIAYAADYRGAMGKIDQPISKYA